MSSQIPGILIAIREDRTEDALELIETLVDERGAKIAVFAVAQIALMLHDSPNMPLKTLAAMMAAHDNGYDLTSDEVYGFDIMAELLTIAESRASDAEDTDEIREILARYDHRPGSAVWANAAVSIMNTLLAAFRLQAFTPFASMRTLESMERAAFAAAREVAAGNGQEAFDRVLFSPEWNDKSTETEPTDG